LVQIGFFSNISELELFGEFDYQIQSNQSSSIYLEQFDNKNLSINPELTKIFIIEVI